MKRIYANWRLKCGENRRLKLTTVGETEPKTLQRKLTSNFQVLGNFVIQINKKMALKVKGQGQMSQKFNDFECSAHHIFTSSFDQQIVFTRTDRQTDGQTPPKTIPAWHNIAGAQLITAPESSIDNGPNGQCMKTTIIACAISWYRTSICWAYPWLQWRRARAECRVQSRLLLLRTASLRIQ